MRKSLKADSHAWAPQIPKTSLTSGKKNWSEHYESIEVKQTAAARTQGGGRKLSSNGHEEFQLMEQ